MPANNAAASPTCSSQKCFATEDGRRGSAARVSQPGRGPGRSAAAPGGEVFGSRSPPRDWRKHSRGGSLASSGPRSFPLTLQQENPWPAQGELLVAEAPVGREGFNPIHRLCLRTRTVAPHHFHSLSLIVITRALTLMVHRFLSSLGSQQESSL